MTKRPRDRSQRVMQQMRMLRNVVMRGKLARFSGAANRKTPAAHDKGRQIALPPFAAKEGAISRQRG
ncbi:hypothetical protein B6K69_02470 [Fuscovulum blasticum]|nr:hypothetical protein B6K69_02470 [Fuscovulum blasticum]